MPTEKPFTMNEWIAHLDLTATALTGDEWQAISSVHVGLDLFESIEAD